MYTNIAILAVFVFLYSIVSRGVERTPINGAVVYSAFGLLMGPLFLGLLSLDVTAEDLRLLAELALALLLFTDASNTNLTVLKRSTELPGRLLMIGLPLTIALGYLAGVLLFDSLSLIEVALLATMLAPTDAALGKAVVTNPSVPDNVSVGLNVESGLNDGICVPILFLFLVLATKEHSEAHPTMLALILVAEEIGIGLAVGLPLVAVSVWLIRRCERRGWITESWRQLPVAALAVSCFSLAQTLGGSGFIAAFAGGMLFGHLVGEKKEPFLVAAEGIGDTFALLTWVAFGAAVIGHTIDQVTWQVVLYVVLSLTVIRMLPVFVVLTGSGLRTDEKLFVGWFGPRGLASIVFAVIVTNEHLPGGDLLRLVVGATIVISILAHGLSANPLADLLARRKSSTP